MVTEYLTPQFPASGIRIKLGGAWDDYVPRGNNGCQSRSLSDPGSRSTGVGVCVAVVEKTTLASLPTSKPATKGDHVAPQ